MRVVSVQDSDAARRLVTPLMEILRDASWEGPFSRWWLKQAPDEWIAQVSADSAGLPGDGIAAVVVVLSAADHMGDGELVLTRKECFERASLLLAAVVMEGFVRAGAMREELPAAELVGIFADPKSPGHPNWTAVDTSEDGKVGENLIAGWLTRALGIA